MSESVKARLEKLEAATDGQCCPMCGRFHDDEKEAERLRAKAVQEIDWSVYARLFDDGLASQAADELNGGMR